MHDHMRSRNLNRYQPPPGKIPVDIHANNLEKINTNKSYLSNDQTMQIGVPRLAWRWCWSDSFAQQKSQKRQHPKPRKRSGPEPDWGQEKGVQNQWTLLGPQVTTLYKLAYSSFPAPVWSPLRLTSKISACLPWKRKKELRMISSSIPKNEGWLKSLSISSNQCPSTKSSADSWWSTRLRR